jgi:hypothetical protein
MRLPLLPVVAAAAVVTLSAPPDPLRVLRSAPGAIAAPTDTIVFGFDRPVAGGLDAVVDPAEAVRIEPAIAARYEWRDPVTLRVIPRAPLPRGARYDVTVATTLRGLDGSTLAAPHVLRFRVRGATLVGGTPVGGVDTARHVPQRPTLTLAWDAPVRATDVARAARLLPLPGCRTPSGGTPAPVTLTPARAGAPPSDTVRLIAERALPADCPAVFEAPGELEADGTPRADATVRWAFRTHGAFRLAEVRCLGRPWCPHGPLLVRFTTPVAGAALARALRLAPAAAFDLDTTAVSDTWRLDARLAPRRAYALIAAPALRDVFGQSLTGNPSAGVRTTGYAPDVQAPFGRLTVERTGFRTLAVRTMNVDTLLVERLPVPDTALARLLAGGEWRAAARARARCLRAARHEPPRRQPGRGVVPPRPRAGDRPRRAREDRRRCGHRVGDGRARRSRARGRAGRPARPHRHRARPRHHRRGRHGAPCRLRVAASRHHRGRPARRGVRERTHRRRPRRAPGP